MLLQDHCGAPKSNMGCCYSNTKCYLKDDCASFISGCGFTNDGKKGESLSKCLPDASTFKEAKCPAGAENAADIPIDNPTLKCWAVCICPLLFSVCRCC